MPSMVLEVVLWWTRFRYELLPLLGSFYFRKNSQQQRKSCGPLLLKKNIKITAIPSNMLVIGNSKER